jgi:hypothetical protein
MLAHPPVGKLDADLIDLYGDDWSVTVADRLYVRLLGPRGDDHDPMLEGDPLIAPYFADRMNRRWLELHQAAFLRALVRSEDYSGRQLAEAHAGVVNRLTDAPITNEVFDRMVGHAVAVLEEMECPKLLTDQVARVVRGLRGQVVAHHPGTSRRPQSGS